MAHKNRCLFTSLSSDSMQLPFSDLNLSIFTLMHVIKAVCCIVGGETIKSISQQSGARIELQRNPPPNADPNMKMFTIRGTPQQIDYARQLIEEKIGVSIYFGLL